MSGLIATEEYAANLSGFVWEDQYRCVTKARANALNCAVTEGYADNQLVPTSALSRMGSLVYLH